MRKFYIPLSVTALAVLGACASREPATPAPIVVTPAPVVTAPAPTPPTVVVQQPSGPAVVSAATARPGFGRIESISALPPTAAAGAGSKPMRRIGIKMEDGTVQYVDTAAEGLSIGSRVELTSDGYIRHPA